MNCIIFSSWALKSPEAATRGVLWKKVLLEISQNSQENTCAGVSFNKVAGLTSGGSDTALTVSEQE